MEALGHLGVYLDGTHGLTMEGLKRTSLEKLCEINNTKRVSQIRLIGAELQHCLLIADDRIRCLCDLIPFRRKFFKGCGQHFLTDLEHILLRRKAHLKIQLVKFSGRAVCSGVLITEAGRNLKILIKAGYHEQLLILLRCLGQRIKFSFKLTAGHDIISGTFRRRRTQNRGLDLQKSKLCHLLTEE